MFETVEHICRACIHFAYQNDPGWPAWRFCSFSYKGGVKFRPFPDHTCGHWQERKAGEAKVLNLGVDQDGLYETLSTVHEGVVQESVRVTEPVESGKEEG